MVKAADSMKLRRQLVGELERRELIRSEHVRDAFLAVPRELFVREFAAREGLAAVYRDEAIPTKHGEHGVPLSSSSQPAVMALMLEQLELEEGMRVLEVGAGTGYNAALLSLLVGKQGRVVSVDVDAQIAAEARRTLRDFGYEVRIVHADGRAGYAETAPYDRIIVTASADAVPRDWFEQLADDGLIEVPLRLNSVGAAQAIPVLRKTSTGFRSLRAVAGGFMPLRGADESGVPDPLREPRLTITDTTHEGLESVLQLSGSALNTLSRAAKRRLLTTVLGEPRRRPLGLRADHGALGLYLSLTLPKSRLVSSFPTFRIGAISRDGASLALIELGRPDRPKVDALKAYGDDDAEEFLLEHVRTWTRRGRPAASDLKLTVTYEKNQSRLSLRWPPIYRGAGNTSALR
jgi:protein-L-isoaspartate(D-aspartate) O-methyltransferase